MADAEPALPPPPAPAVPEPVPLLEPAPEPDVVAAAPRMEQEVNVDFCHESSLAFKFRKLGFSSTFCRFAYLFAFHVFSCLASLPLAIFGLRIGSELVAFLLASVFLFDFIAVLRFGLVCAVRIPCV